MLLVSVSAFLIYFDCVTYSLYMYAKITIFKQRNAVSGVTLHSYLPITVTSLQLPVFFVPKATVVEWFDCNYKSLHLLSFLSFFHVLWFSTQIYNLSNCLKVDQYGATFKQNSIVRVLQTTINTCV